MGKIVSIDHNTNVFAQNVASVMANFVVVMGEIAGVVHNSVDVMDDFVDFMGDYNSIMIDLNSVLGENADFAHKTFVIIHNFNDFDRSVNESMSEIQGNFSDIIITPV